MSQPEPDDVSRLDDFQVLSERRRVMESLAFLTQEYKRLTDEMTQERNPQMDGGTVSARESDDEAMARLEPVYAEAQAANLELSLRNAREYRQDMARWLAAEVLMTDPVACQDAMLQEHLLILQDKIEEKMRRAA